MPTDKTARAPAPPARRTLWLLLAVAAAATSLGAGWWVGATRAAAPTPIERFTHIHGLDAPAWADGDLVVATHFGLVRRTPEGAWFAVGNAQHDFMGFRAHPTEPGVLYGSGHPDLRTDIPNPMGLVVSRDGGLSWQPVALQGRADFHALAVQRGDGRVLVGFNVVGEVGLLRSLDGGLSWSTLPSEPLLAVGGVIGLDVHPNDADRLLATTPAGLWATDDAGRSWGLRAFEGAYVTAVRYAPEDDGRVYAYVADPGLGLMLSEDGGATWASLGLALTGNDAVGHIAPHPTDPQRLHVGSFGMDVLATADGGGSWTVWARGGVPR
jgi:hypothetical protein